MRRSLPPPEPGSPGASLTCSAAQATGPPTPRLVNLGKRIILSRSNKPDDAMAHVTFATPQNYQRWRYVHGVAEGDELPQGALHRQACAPS